MQFVYSEIMLRNMNNQQKKSATEPAIRMVMLPKYTNPDGDIFGGVILSMIDEAAAVEAQRQMPHRYVSVSMDSIQFYKPVGVGDIVSLWCKTIKVGTSSLEIQVDVQANPWRTNEEHKVTEATVVMVAIDENRKSIPIFPAKKQSAMRRKDKEITDPVEIEKIIKEAQVCRLAMVDGNKPYVVPLSFGYEGESLFFHSGHNGRKIDILRNNPTVCFEMDLQGDILEADVPCKWTTQYRSVIGSGEVEFVENPDEKKNAFRIIMAHYSDRIFEFTDEMLKSVVILKVKIAEISAKKSGY